MCCRYDMVPEFPTAIRHRLVAHIRMHAPAPRADAANASNCPPRELSQHACLAVRAACLDALSSLLVGYRNHVTRVRLKHATKLNQPVDSQPHLQDKASFAHESVVERFPALCCLPIVLLVHAGCCRTASR